MPLYPTLSHVLRSESIITREGYAQHAASLLLNNDSPLPTPVAGDEAPFHPRRVLTSLPLACPDPDEVFYTAEFKVDADASVQCTQTELDGIGLLLNTKFDLYPASYDNQLGRIKMSTCPLTPGRRKPTKAEEEESNDTKKVVVVDEDDNRTDSLVDGVPPLEKIFFNCDPMNQSLLVAAISVRKQKQSI